MLVTLLVVASFLVPLFGATLDAAAACTVTTVTFAFQIYGQGKINFAGVDYKSDDTAQVKVGCGQ